MKFEKGTVLWHEDEQMISIVTNSLHTENNRGQYFRSFDGNKKITEGVHTESGWAKHVVELKTEAEITEKLLLVSSELTQEFIEVFKSLRGDF